ncbi:MAG: PilZ domain-containing protein [Pseudomonas sp.]|uniref:PilZ domain-containing protein n=1 Tax=Pseudomonas sp. TaxID=306 RepID=UPI0033946606
MSDQSPLSQDERDFIRQLLVNPVLGKPVQTPSFRVDGGDQANALLARLAANTQLSLESHFDDHWMSFPLQLVEDEFHALHLQMGAPCIYENGPVLRPWRLHLDEPIALQDDEGGDPCLAVRELSPNGLLISSPGKAPLHFSLWLPLPGQEPIPLQAKRVRTVGNNRTAYRLVGCHARHTERIRHFIFEQHRLKHPQLCLP